MRKSPNNIFLLAALLSVIIPFLIIVDGQFPYLGLAVSFASLSSLIFFTKQQRSFFTKACYTLSLILSFMLIYRSQPFLTLLNFIATATTIAAMILDHAETKRRSLIKYVISAFDLFYESLKTTNIFTFKTDQHPSHVLGKSLKKLDQSIIPIGITVIILLVMVPLLASANPIFEQNVEGVLKIFDMSAWLESFNENFIAISIFRILVFGFLISMLPKALSLAHQGYSLQISPEKRIDMTIPKIAVSLLLVLFFITQIQLYTASTESLLEMGYTHSRLSREVFGQLSLVSLIVFSLIYYDRYQEGRAKILNLILLTEGVFLGMMAFKSVYDYSYAHGFTFARLWGFTAVFWMMGIYAVTWYLMSKKKAEHWFAQSIFLFSLLVLVGVNVINFENLIYRVRPPTVNGEVDRYYIRTHLSADAYHYHEELPQAPVAFPESYSPEDHKVYSGFSNLKNQGLNLKSEYQDLDWRGFNVSRYWQYQAIKNMNLESILKPAN